MEMDFSEITSNGSTLSGTILITTDYDTVSSDVATSQFNSTVSYPHALNSFDASNMCTRTPPRTKRIVSAENSVIATPPPSLKRCVSDLLLSSPMGRDFPLKKHGKLASPNSSGDRFIPNRSHLHLDVCRASVMSADKCRLAAIDRQRLGQGSNIENKDPNNTLGASSQQESTPVQTEFRFRMREALLRIDHDDIRHNMEIEEVRNANLSSGPTRDSSQEVPEGDRSRRTSNLIRGNVEKNLVYMDIAGIRDQNEDINSASTDRNIRVLSFKSSILSNDVASKSSAFQLTEDIGSSSFSTPKRARRPIQGSPWRDTIDPYAHDQLHVIQRSTSFSPYSHSDVLREGDYSFTSAKKKIGRRINATPTRILDAPELVDDYYLNLISWGKDNILAVALGQCVYLWNAQSGDINHLVTLSGSDDYVTSVQWCDMQHHTNYIAVGTSEGPVQLWDAANAQKVRTMKGHSLRVGALSWSQHWLSSGGRDSFILQHDVRSPVNIVSSYCAHTQEVCGLKWNEDGNSLASGGNENYVCIWDATMSAMSGTRNQLHGSSRVAPRLVLTRHSAAVKALAWCPFHRGLLASGGGTADGTIKFWNSNSGAVLNSISTGSQVCSLLWSKHQRELCSSHGFSENQLVLWKYPTMTRVQEFKGHTARVLNTDQSPDGTCVVSAAADETLRFWDIFGPPPSKAQNDQLSIGNLSSRLSIIR